MPFHTFFKRIFADRHSAVASANPVGHPDIESVPARTQQALRSEKHEAIRAAGLFDPQFYLDSYEDVKSSSLDPWLHFLQFGGQEARDPHPLFDTRYYIKCHPEVLESGFHPACHYLENGENLGF